jgi:hypothetical protein
MSDYEQELDLAFTILLIIGIPVIILFLYAFAHLAREVVDSFDKKKKRNENGEQNADNATSP